MLASKPTHGLAGRKQSPEHLAKRMAAWQVSTAKAKASARFAALNESRKGIPLPEETRKKQSVALKGKQNALGVKRSVEFRKNLSDYWANNQEKHNHFVDGNGAKRTTIRRAEMGRLEYRLWRESVFERDNWTCQLCFRRGCRLEADHIKPWAKFPELRIAIDNGRTLCYECHRKGHRGPGSRIRT